jgi:pyruvate formate lyase activating enzyme
MGLPVLPPRNPHGIKCSICVNECQIGEGERGYCGIWTNKKGKLQPIQGKNKLLMFTYLDPLPTNCVATPVCPAATGRGYPEFTDTMGPEYGFYNLAVFMGGCPLDCLFCQNPEHKIMVKPPLQVRYIRTMDDLISEALNPKVRCVCYFGGDPTPHSPFLIVASRRIIERARSMGQRFKRICWETDGLMNPSLMKAAGKISLETGGIVKIDWKA